MNVNVKMNFKYLCMITLFVITVISCQNRKAKFRESVISFNKFPYQDSIFFDNLFEFENGVARRLLLLDSNLIILNSSVGSKYALYNYSLKDNILSNGYLNIGKGPNEVIGANQMSIKSKDLCVYDITMNKILIADLQETAFNTIASFRSFNIEGSYYMISLKDSLHCYCVGDLASNYRIQEINIESGKVVKEYGIYKNINVPIAEFKTAYQCFLYQRPIGDKLVLPYRRTDMFEIYDIKSNNIISIHGPEGFDVVYEHKYGGVAETEKTRYGYLKGSMTNDYIYLSYSGKNFLSTDYFYSNTIFVFDWNGNPIKKFVFDRQIEAFVVSQDNKTIYATDNKTGQIIKANL